MENDFISLFYVFYERGVRKVKVGVAQMAPRLGCVEKNLELHLQLIQRATTEQIDLLVFPELSLTGYSLLDATSDVARPIDSPEIQKLVATTAESKLDLVFGFVEESEEHILYNAAIYCSEGKIRHLHRKVYLPTYGMFDEGRLYGRGGSFRSFPTRFGRLGILICEDAWHPSASYLLAQDGAICLLALANGPVKGIGETGLGAQQAWHSLVAHETMIHGMYGVFANRVGTEDGAIFFGASAIFDPFGQKIAEGERFTEQLLTVDLDLEHVRRARLQMPLLRDEDIHLTIRELQRIQRRRAGEGEWR